MTAESPDLFAVIGNPIAHSRSPAIHQAFAAATGRMLSYERVLSPLDGFAATVREFAQQGARGCNVTVPFKFEAFSLCPRRTDRAILAQAANTVRFDPEGWLADNTDGVGLMRDITVNAGVGLRGKRILLIGAGGAAAGVLGPLMAESPSAIVVANRSVDKAVALVKRHSTWGEMHPVSMTATGLEDPGTAFDVVINASASSLDGNTAPVPSSVLGTSTFTIDLMYGPASRPFLAWAATHGAQVRDGLGMLVEQAAESFALWHGVRPPTAEVLDALRKEVDAGQGAH
jgi:shikimate dehydrogenase